MKVVVLLVFVFGLVVGEEVGKRYHERVGIPTAARIKQQEAMRISGGYLSYLGEHPFYVGLLITLTSGKTSICGGTLVTNRRVLSTGQCWYDVYSQGWSIKAVLGSIKLYSGGTRVNVPSITVHPNYNAYTLANDIAMLTIPYTSYTSNIKPAVLPYSYNISTGLRVQAIGFGKTSEQSQITSGQVLRDEFLSIISNADCRQVYGSIVTDNVLCTSGQSGTGPCGGDAGGPLIKKDSSRYYLIGLISFGSASGCGARHPFGYTRVSSYLTWIQNQL